jgi:hypothetical protein
MFAFIESATGIVWATSVKDISLVDYQTRFPTVPVDTRRNDAPDHCIGLGSNNHVYYRWTGSTYEKCDNLSNLKIIKKLKIDTKTVELIMKGVTYDGQTFGMSYGDQSSWHARYNMSKASLLTFPFEVWTQDNQPYSIPDAVTLEAMYFSGFQQVQTVLAGGRALKSQVNAATTKEQVDAVVDDR